MSKTTKWILLGAGAFVALYLWRSKSATAVQGPTVGAAAAPPAVESGSSYIVGADVIPAAGASLAARGAEIGQAATVTPPGERPSTLTRARRMLAASTTAPVDAANALVSRVPVVGGTAVRASAPIKNYIGGPIADFANGDWKQGTASLLTGGASSFFW